MAISRRVIKGYVRKDNGEIEHITSYPFDFLVNINQWFIKKKSDAEYTFGKGNVRKVSIIIELEK